MQKFSIATLLALLAIFNVKADESVVNWTTSLVMDTPTSGHVVINAQVAEGGHFYAFPSEGGGINALEMSLEATDGVTILGEPAASVAPVIHDEPGQGEVASWEEDVEFTVPFEIENADEPYLITVKLRYQGCVGLQCQTPKRETFNMPINGYVVVEEVVETSEQSAIYGKVSDEISPELQAKWWAPVETQSPVSDQSPWGILIVGFIGGLAALLTPCVWPLIPMTLSFFLKKTKKQNKRFNRDALVYGLSIVIIYLVVGMAITMIFGAGKLNELSTNAIFNIIFFLLLVVFAISFFGAFDIKLPSKWSNALDRRAETTTGFISIFFMAFTLVLVSFSCTGPIIGTLLVEAAAQGEIIGPALGMGGFAIGLALPFTLCAFFPSLLNGMPKSGGWLNSVKVVLGFIELILSLKFLSVADLVYGWHILDRETFIAIWIVLFVLLGMYLLGKIRFSHDEPKTHVGVGAFILAIFPLAFAVYLLPGLWGAPLKSISAFAPPLYTQDFNLYTHDNEYPIFTDYDAGMEFALQSGKPVLLDFSGYGCVNCRNMEAAVFDTDEVRNYLSDNFVVITMMADSREPISPVVVKGQNGNNIEITNEGEKWSYLEQTKFGANSQPYYIVLDNEGMPMNDPVFYDNNVASFINWLETGLNNYKNQ